VVVGYGTDRGYTLAEFDDDLVSAGLVLEHRFATWDLRPWSPRADFAVSVLRVPSSATRTAQDKAGQAQHIGPGPRGASSHGSA
jgi:hypothetical protein